MGMTEKNYAGRCFCGAVGYEVSGAPRFLCYCHCESCRRAAGSPAVAWGTFGRSGFRVTRGRMKEFNSSPKVVRGFCADCGSCLTYSHQGRPGDIDVTLATLEEAANLAPTLHVWVGDKLPWVRIEDGLPQFEAGYSPAAGT
jgi:hypothetical protein